MRSLLVLPMLVALVAGATLDFDHYWTAQEINAYLDELVADFPTLASVVNVGTSTEGRPIRALRVSKDNVATRPLVIVEGGLRAREWISPMSASYILHEIVEHYYEFEHILDNVNFLVVPLANPDGYEFSRTPNNRMWVKSRSVNGNGCFGTDLARNFGYLWNTVGGSSNPCSDSFVGTAAFSAPETAALRDFIQANSANLVLYLSIQSADQMVLYPFSHSAMTNPSNVAELRSLANSVALTLMNQNGRIFTVGGAGLLQPAASGSSIDYVAGTFQPNLVYTLETGAGGTTGYDVPEAQMAEYLSETTYGFLTMATYVADNK
ncbi:carboxypeptidase B-like [Anopheles ziemanni]|uniref:carboxypeptidase B-like n=1 Tax=Anopheles coustani TaxID=139045 RepID=UPI002659BAFB|nr:carboxypeptidase B-like [Anopheles coustani]XP_058167433.1 carboxypeptidase B-like [Anopheles ziemanni]